MTKGPSRGPFVHAGLRSAAVRIAREPVEAIRNAVPVEVTAAARVALTVEPVFPVAAHQHPLAVATLHPARLAVLVADALAHPVAFHPGVLAATPLVVARRPHPAFARA